MMEALVKLKSFGIECLRVLRVTRKPTKQEFWTVAKAAALGMAVIGLLGFAVHLIRQYLFPAI
ncbi:protein translocase SEC61 complex subunit gamma [Candidatus Woesearchaeota archaeon]|nr:protein translocase SEC61 complex subunit gamma [Candidatus Woesearchaeota archaeon]